MTFKATEKKILSRTRRLDLPDWALAWVHSQIHYASYWWSIPNPAKKDAQTKSQYQQRAIQLLECIVALLDQFEWEKKGLKPQKPQTHAAKVRPQP